MKGCIYTLSTGQKLDYDQMREHLLNNYQELLENDGNLTPEQKPTAKQAARVSQTAPKARKTYESIINRASGISEEQRELLKQDPNRYYTPESSQQSQEIAVSIINDVGLDNAVELAKSDDKSIPEVIKIAILGQAVNDYSKLKDYSAEAEAFDKFREATEELAKKATHLGRAIAQMKQVYKLSGLGMVARLQKIIAQKVEKYTQEDINKKLEKVREELQKQFGGFSVEEENIKKIVTERSEKLNKAVNLVRRLRGNLKGGKLYDASLGIPVAILDMGLAALEQALIAGVAINDAVEIAIEKIRAKLKEQNKTFDEVKFKNFIKEKLGEDFYNELENENKVSTNPNKDMVEKAKDKLEQQSKKFKIGNVTLTNTAVHKIFKIILTEQAKGKKFNYSDKNVAEKVNNAILEGLGLKLSEDDSNLAFEIAEKLKSPNVPYFIARQYEEIMQYLLKKNGVRVKRDVLVEGMLQSTLSSIVNTIQNTLGFLKVVSTLFTVMAKTKSVKNPLQVFVNELRLARQEAKTIMQGRVSRGISYKDLIEGKTQGEIAVRFLEYYQGNNFFWKSITLQKYVARLLEATDTFASAASSGLNDYAKIKMYVNKFYPELSEKERTKIEFDIMYGEVTQADRDKAKDDLIKSGVSNPTEAEISRTTYERLVRKRDEKAKDEYDKFLEQKIEDAKKLGIQGESNQLQWARMFAGDFDYVVAEGQEKAQIDTGKLDTAGLATAVASVYDVFLQGLKSQEKKTTSETKKTAFYAADILARVGAFPFISSIARWTEIGLELTPYGVVKGTAYKATGLLQKKGIIAEKNEKLGSKNIDMGTDFIMRGLLGAIYTAGIFAVVKAINASLKSEGEDDEEEKSAITSMDKKAKIGEEKVASAGKPKQSIKIGDRYFPLQMLGSAYVPVMWYASIIEKMEESIKNNEKLSPEKQENLAEQITLNAVATTFIIAWESSWIQSAERYGGTLGDIGKGNGINLAMLGYPIGRTLGSVVSLNRFQQEVGQLINPQSKEQKTFAINALNQISIIKAFTPGNPNFDYRGRTYDVGQIYVNTADGLRKFIFGAPKYRDDIDNWLTNMKYAISNSYRSTKSEDINKYHLFDKETFEMRNLSDEEWYNFRYNTAKKFNENLTSYYESKRWENLTDENKRKVVSLILTLTKESVIAEMNNMSKKLYDKITKKEEENLEDKSADKIYQSERDFIKKAYKF